MMRSAAPRIEHDATVKVETGGGAGAPFEARATNLSVGGLFVQAPTVLAPGAQVDLRVSLRDGGGPVHAKGEVVWVDERDRESRGMALRFIELAGDAERRIAKLVALRTREPTGVGRRQLRIHLPSLSTPLRAVARDETDRGLMLEAELPWLTLGSQIVAELSPERAVEGVVRWVGLDVTRAGHARLRIFVDTGGEEPSMRPAVLAQPIRPQPKRGSRVLAALGVVAAMAVAAGATALSLRPALPPSVLALPLSDGEAPKARPPALVAVPRQAPVDDVKPATHHHRSRKERDASRRSAGSDD
jgi:uncharacterized protein (TIGR02266 family)